MYLSEQTQQKLDQIKNTISNPQNVEKIKEIIFAYADENGRGEVLSPLRVSLSGLDKSPDPFTLLYVLGKEESKSRIKNAINILSS